MSQATAHQTGTPDDKGRRTNGLDLLWCEGCGPGVAPGRGATRSHGRRT
ncbi:hypothetical protein SGM_4233 [Streptomyces griseoaurantiacus M045]|uniref:Uncharacterized protein n=1 Tax=Streptomyces griseoaurantiacus M045 TaxID=996637 RepID=F3NLX8_9ACTN|nr:hypothetical protein SGM_4233 [Streptomyces griseoaurantiacus M045]